MVTLFSQLKLHSVALSPECCQPVFMGSNEMDSLLKTVKLKSMATFFIIVFSLIRRSKPGFGLNSHVGF